MKLPSQLRANVGAGRPLITVSQNHVTVTVQFSVSLSDPCKKCNIQPTSIVQLSEDAIEALEALGVYEDRGTDSKNILVAQTSEESTASGGAGEVPVPEVPPEIVPVPPRPLRRPSMPAGGRSIRRSPLSQRADGGYERVFAGYRCRVEGCRFVASTLQHVKHHEQTSSHCPTLYAVEADTVFREIVEDDYDDPFSDDAEVF